MFDEFSQPGYLFIPEITALLIETTISSVCAELFYPALTQLMLDISQSIVVTVLAVVVGEIRSNKVLLYYHKMLTLITILKYKN